MIRRIQKWLQYRKASRVLQHAKHYLWRQPLTQTEWSAVKILTEAQFQVEDEYYLNR